MIITYEDIKKANDAIKTTAIKEKQYAEVNQRIKAFRMVCPDGFIKTELVSNENGVCVMVATVGYYSKDGATVVLGMGTAYEKEGSTFINKTSYIENCETSAVGRALGMAGFGIDTSVASYEEVQNAMANQVKTGDEIISSIKANALIKRCEEDGVSPEKIAKEYKVKNVFALTEKMHSNINLHWEKVIERCPR